MEEMMNMMSGTKERAKPRWWMGVIWFAVVMVVVLFAFGPIQNALGMPGLVVTELILLAMAVVPAIVMKWNLKEVFSIRLPKIRQIFGDIVFQKAFSGRIQKGYCSSAVGRIRYCYADINVFRRIADRNSF